jgi:putative aminopeptidase FrvX
MGRIIKRSSENKIIFPTIGREQLRLLARLCNACAVSGDEGEVRAIVLEQIRPYVDEVNIDALGNVLALRAGLGNERMRVMVASHMDEVGMVITHAEDKNEGLFRFEIVGGINEAQIPGKPVWIGHKHLPGVIGSKPVHLTKKDELDNTLSLDVLRIDCGSGNGEKVNIGDRAAFSTRFKRLGPSLRAKALDDRLGVVTLIELLKHSYPNIDLMAAFTVQEEVGLRGARVAAFALDPQIAIVLDCTPAYDLPTLEKDGLSGEENTRYNTRLGDGPAIYLSDSGTIYDRRLVQHFTQTATELSIPFQFRQPGSGSTDAGTIHKQRTGIPSVAISVPGRYLHTAAALVRLEDWINHMTLVYAGLSRIEPGILNYERG